MLLQQFFARMWLVFQIMIVPSLSWGALLGSATDIIRPFRVDDLFEFEGISGPYEISKNDDLAFTRWRPQKTLPNHKWFYEGLGRDVRGDVWVHIAHELAPVNITNGIVDGSGWFSPQWSPDGKRLAMLSTRDGKLQLWVWNIKTRKLKPLGRHRVSVPLLGGQPYVWLDSNRLLYTAVPDTIRIPPYEWPTPTIATQEWAKAFEGKVATASRLDSGSSTPSRWPEAHLLTLDLEGKEQLVAEGITTRFWSVSPDGIFVAFPRQTRLALDRTLTDLYRAPGEWSIQLYRTDGKLVSLHGALPQNVLASSLRWSPDSSTLAVIDYPDNPASPQPRQISLHRINAKTGVVSKTQLAGWSVSRSNPQLEWTASDDLLVQASTAETRSSGRAGSPWWLLKRRGSPQLLWRDLRSAPGYLIPQPGRKSFVGLVDGDLWRLNPSTNKVENLTKDVGQSISEIVWPAAQDVGSDPGHQNTARHLHDYAANEVIIALGDDAPPKLHLFDFASRLLSAIPQPAVPADLVAYAPTSTTLLFCSRERSGLRLWRENGRTRTSQLLVETNTFLRDVEAPVLKPLKYTSLNGDPLEAWLILPAGYTSQKRFPLLTHVYPWEMYSSAESPDISKQENSYFLNMNIAAAQGYMVLLPSMPNPGFIIPKTMIQSDLFGLPALTNGVIPAIDKAIENGFADAKRLAVIGRSAGGYAVYGLVAQTSRFKAAIALAGLSNLTSLYGAFDASVRYTPYARENVHIMMLIEGNFPPMGKAPWAGPTEYFNRSPVSFVDRVETPLMIIQGDNDFVSMQQGEEFFTALARQRKRAAFVRYWGEGHSLNSAANIRDAWEQIFGWLDQNLANEPAPR